MNRDTDYTRIVCNRSDLFDICRHGFVAQRIGDLWCTGWMLTDRLSNLTVPYRIA